MTVKCVERIVDKAIAEPKKVFKVNRTHGTVYECVTAFGCLHLYHYKTLILTVNIPERSVVEWGGYSTTDVQAINTVLRHLNIGGTATRAGGWLRVETWEGNGK